MNPELEETIYADFITSSPTTGAATDADSTPTCEVFEDATDAAILSPTVVKRTGKTGNYRVPVACTAANGFEAGKSYNVVASATVGTIAAKAVVQTFQMRTNGADDLAASILTRSSQTTQDTLATYVDTEVAAIKAKTDNLPIDPADASDIAASFTTVNATLATIAGYVDTEVAAIKAKTDNLPTDPADASDIAASFTALNTKVDTIDDFLDTEVAAIKAKTDQLVFTVANRVDATATMTISAGDLTSIADAILKRDFSAVSGEAARSLLNAARFLRNKFSIAGTTLTVCKEDDAAPAWTSTVSTDVDAPPITGSDPA